MSTAFPSNPSELLGLCWLLSSSATNILLNCTHYLFFRPDEESSQHNHGARELARCLELLYQDDTWALYYHV